MLFGLGKDNNIISWLNLVKRPFQSTLVDSINTFDFGKYELLFTLAFFETESKNLVVNELKTFHLLFN